MTRTISAVLLAALALVFSGCSSSNNSTKMANNVPPLPNISGAWEFTLASSNGQLTGMEVALQEGKVLTNGVNQPDGNISASGIQISFVTFNIVTGLANGFGGYCTTPGPASGNSIAGAVITLGGPVTNFTFTENGNVFDVTATLGGDGQSMQGAYASETATNCLDSGTFSGKVVPKLSGNYIGTLTLPSCPASTTGCDTANATLTESASGSATLTLQLSGTDQTSLTLTGPVTGNVFSVQGNFQGESLVLAGYFELTGSQADVPTLYLVNSTNTVAPKEAGLLTVVSQ